MNKFRRGPYRVLNSIGDKVFFVTDVHLGSTFGTTAQFSIYRQKSGVRYGDNPILALHLTLPEAKALADALLDASAEVEAME